MRSVVRDFKNLMKSQIRAGLTIQEKFGLQKALDYLIGEKLYVYLKDFESDPDVIDALPFFIHEIKKHFEPDEISDYFLSIQQLGSSGLSRSDGDYENLKKTLFPEDPILDGSADIVKSVSMPYVS